MRNHRGATVVITGASSGIGRAAALAFGKELHDGRGRKTALAAATLAVPALGAGAWLRR